MEFRAGTAVDHGRYRHQGRFLLNFRFHHNETDWGADLVDLPTFISHETVTVDGRKYKVMLTGLKQKDHLVRQFVSPEGTDNSADIIAVFARQPGEPDVTITDVHYEGAGKAQPDEYVEILDRGTEPEDISGWILGADDADQDFTFPEGSTVEPGHRIRVYTNENHSETGGYCYGVNKAIWNNQGDVAHIKDKHGKALASSPYGDKA